MDTLKTLPLVFTDPQELNVTFNLFTRNNRNNRQIFSYGINDRSIQESEFKAERKTKFIVHGYRDKYEEDGWMAVRD